MNLRKLKRNTARLIAASLEHPWRRDGRTDYIEKGITTDIERINRNPDLVPTGSCSGHSGVPFLSVIFKDARTRDRNKKRIQKLGLHIHKSDDYRMTFFEDEPGITEEWNIGPRKRLTKKEARDFWQTLVGVFGV